MARLVVGLGLFGLAYAAIWLLIPGGRRILSSAVLAFRGATTPGQATDMPGNGA